MPLNSRPRVLFVIGSMGGGGAERQILQIIKRLDRTRFEPFLYLAMKQGELLDKVPADVPIFAYWDGTPETWLRRVLRLFKLTQLLRYIHLAKVLRSQNIDVIYDRTYLATLDAAGGTWLRQTPRISCCVVDPGPELELHVRLSIWVSRWFARRAYQSASVVLANSEGLRLRLIDYFQLKPDHVKVFYNLLTDPSENVPVVLTNDASIGKPLLEDQSNRLNLTAVPESLSSSEITEQAVNQITRSIKEGAFLIVTAGRLHPQKGHRFLLEAIEELVHQRKRSLHLVIFGKGESEQALREFIRDHQLESYVTLAGFVDDPRDWYQKANLFVLPSLYEGMPNALIEAIATGVPALSTDCPSGPSEIMDDGRCGRLVPPGDSKAIADGIVDAMDHPQEWRMRAELARQHVKNLFDTETGTHRLEDLLEQVAARHPITV